MHVMNNTSMVVKMEPQEEHEKEVLIVTRGSPIKLYVPLFENRTRGSVIDRWLSPPPSKKIDLMCYGKVLQEEM